MTRTIDRVRRPAHALRALLPAATLFCILLGGTATANAATPDERRLLATLQKAHPGTQFSAVKRSPVAGLYEVWMNANVAYVAPASTRYFIFGRVFDTQAMRDITEPQLAQAAQVSAAAGTNDVVPMATGVPIAIDALPLQDAIKTVRGNGQRKLVVFSDPNCVFCKRLEPELATLDDVTIYTFLVPFQGEATPIAIWCAKDRDQAWHGLMLRGDTTALGSAAPCAHPIQRNLALAHRLAIRGTPTLIWPDGGRSDGYLDRSALLARLQRSIPADRP